MSRVAVTPLYHTTHTPLSVKIEGLSRSSEYVERFSRACLSGLVCDDSGEAVGIDECRNFSRVHVAQVVEPSSGQDRWIVVLARKSFHFIHVSPHFA